MGKKEQTLEELLEVPWCYYCERAFDDLKVLQDHQRARHFKCHHCNRRLNTINGLRVHSEQVHKMQVTDVDNCTIPERNTLDREIYGMEGIPEDVLIKHRQHVTNEYYKRQNEWKIKTGNPISGPNPNKKKREFEEDPEAFKARLEEHKRKRRAEKAAREAGLTVDDGAAAAPNAISQSDATNQTNYGSSAGFEQNIPATTSTFPSPYAAAPAFNPVYPPPPFAGAPPMAGNLPMSYTPPNTYGDQAHYPVPGQGYPPAVAGYPAPGPYPPPLPPGPHGGYMGAPAVPSPLGYPNGMASSPPPPFQVPLQSNLATPPTLPAGLPSLPSRPSFSMPNVSREDMEKMHTGSRPQQQAANSSNADAVEDLIAGILAEKDAQSAVPDANVTGDTGSKTTVTEQAAGDVKEKPAGQSAAAEAGNNQKKKKENALRRLVVHTEYANPENSIEETMASWGIYNSESVTPSWTVTDVTDLVAV